MARKDVEIAELQEKLKTQEDLTAKLKLKVDRGKFFLIILTFSRITSISPTFEMKSP